MESEIIEILKNIEKRLETIEEHLGIVKEDCSKMGKHIHFVEKTYNVLRQPLNYVTRMINCKSNELPKIKNVSED
jgi:CTP-dependent riboflavin kinase